MSFIQESGGAKVASPIKTPTTEEALANIHKLTGGRIISIEELKSLSPEKFPEEMDEKLEAQFFLMSLFEPSEHVNIITHIAIGDDLHVRPVGPGATKTMTAWVKDLEQGLPEHEAGIWVRPNPVKRLGSGVRGTHKDADVTAYRLLLLECDGVPIEEQVSLFAHLRLPIASLVTSGGRSVHALIRLDAKSETEFKNLSRQILARLHCFGADRSNSNPSRMTRLPGGIRKIGGVGEGFQRLLYLNHEPKFEPIVR